MIEIPISLLNSKIQNITSTEIINILNSLPTLNKVQNNVFKGKISEKSIENIIENFEIEKRNTHSGDMIIWKKDYPNIKIMIEVKDYTNTIPNDEYQKFINDLEHNHYAGGIIIANQNIQGIKPNTIDNNKMFINTYDPQIINISCECLWARLFERYHYKFIDSESEIIVQCNILANSIERLTNIKSNIELMKKNNEKLLKKIFIDIDLDIIEIRKVINKIVNKISRVDITMQTSKLELPTGDYFHQSNLVVKEKIEELINKIHISICPLDNFIASINKNKMEINFNGIIKILFEFLKTKTIIKFKPKVFHFEGTNINYVDGLVEIVINKGNFSTYNLVEIIEKFLDMKF